ncbi:hypothetical protein ANCDUO_03098 [Ancylostoma duodenale]|uniref:Uncharacterized protein n=1 Tax=Ancylostoma duodenale TaxID=51022 RepID=A0A0C2H4T8_9BILA|nr:hypothetical protein ANCDUO_03098 [Ancylostoma duodenale]
MIAGMDVLLILLMELLIFLLTVNSKLPMTVMVVNVKTLSTIITSTKNKQNRCERFLPVLLFFATMSFDARALVVIVGMCLILVRITFVIVSLITKTELITGKISLWFLICYLELILHAIWYSSVFHQTFSSFPS